ncbi:MAG: penicillin-binding protein 2 [Armatimonadetes bacterium]|nr:penicillin-binding protein 2 [Armatimonadota bacterium]
MHKRAELESQAPHFQPLFRQPAGQPGNILDAKGRVLATSVQTYAVKIDPQKFREEFRGQPAEMAKAIRLLAAILGVPEDHVRQKVYSPASWQYLVQRVPAETKHRLMRAIRSGEPKIPYITTEVQYRREYPLGTTACWVLGWRGVDHAARAGLEQTYDFLLTGLPGSAVGSRDKWGRLILWPAARRPVEARPGRSIMLTIDADIQQATELALDHLMMRHTPRRGCGAIVMDPRTGRILAMAAKPSFDPNEFSGTVQGRRPTEKDLLNPLVNYGFEPGSVMKTFTIAAALDAGLTREEETFSCPGSLPNVGGRPLRCADGHAHGAMRLADVLARSCNISAARLAMRLGGERETEALRRFGFGAPTRVGFNPEGHGSLPPAPGEPVLRERDVANLGFGQGMAVTLMQLAAGYCALVNGGVYMQPMILDRVLKPTGEEWYSVPPVQVRRVCSQRTSEQIRRMLQLVVDEGTGKRACIPGVKVGGKTGTAQKPGPKGGYREGAYIAVFVLVLPADNPRYVITVMADEPCNGYHGGTVAAPAAREIAMAILRLERTLPPEAEKTTGTPA